MYVKVGGIIHMKSQSLVTFSFQITIHNQHSYSAMYSRKTSHFQGFFRRLYTSFIRILIQLRLNYDFPFFIFQSPYLESGFLSVAAVANLVQIGISIHCQVSARSQYLVRFLSLYWITGGHTVHPPIEGLLPPTVMEPTTFRNLASKVSGLQVHATTLG